MEHMANTAHAVPALGNPCLQLPVCSKPLARCWHQLQTPHRSSMRAANRENIRLPSALEVSAPKEIWAIANTSPAGTKRQLPARWQLMLSTEGTAGATWATDTENCAVNMGCTMGCEL